MPVADASQCVDATIPKVPRSSGLVVKVTRRNVRGPYRARSALRALDDLDGVVEVEVDQRVRKRPT
jgi:hypothetical protein